MAVRTISFPESGSSLHPVIHRSGRSSGTAVTHVYVYLVACATKYRMPSLAARRRVVLSTHHDRDTHGENVSCVPFTVECADSWWR